MSYRYKSFCLYKVDPENLPPFGKDLVLITDAGRILAGRLDYLNASGLHFKDSGGEINGVTEWADGTELLPKPEEDRIPRPQPVTTKALQFTEPELANTLPAIPQDNLNPVVMEGK